MRVESPTPEVRTLLTGRERRDGNWSWRPRGTSTPLLIYTRAGNAVVRVTEDVEQTISAGDAVLWAPGAAQDFGCRPGGGTWELVWAHFSPRESWHEWLTWPMLGPGLGRIAAPSARVRDLIEDGLLDMDRYAHSALPRGVDLAMNALERALLWLDVANPGPPRPDDRIQEAVEFVACQLDRPLSVHAIADAVHLSPSRLTHLFKEQLGVSPRRFVELRRVARAQALLESSSLAIAAIADATGFSSQFYFATRFRTLTGMTPSEWRRRASELPPA